MYVRRHVECILGDDSAEDNVEEEEEEGSEKEVKNDSEQEAGS